MNTFEAYRVPEKKMRFALRLSILLLTLLSTLSVYAQSSHIKRRYVKDINVTVVEADSLYVINMPTQFMLLQLKGRYPNQGPPAQMPNISLQFYSYTAEGLYQNPEAQRLAVKADDKILDFGPMIYAGLQESVKGSHSIDQKSTEGMNSSMPPDALIRNANKGKPLRLELMTLNEIRPDELTELANARQVIMKIGTTVFALTATQMSIAALVHAIKLCQAQH
jgi:hypothetical protein